MILVWPVVKSRACPFAIVVKTKHDAILTIRFLIDDMVKSTELEFIYYRLLREILGHDYTAKIIC